MTPLSVLDLDEFEWETPEGAVSAHERGHLRAIERFFPGVRAAIEDGHTVYLDGPNRISLKSLDQVMRLACVYLAGARAEARWRIEHGEPMAIASGCVTDRARLREMCAAAGLDADAVEIEAWSVLEAIEDMDRRLRN
jgi:hypothetical protein